MPLVNLNFYILIYVGHLAIHFVHNHWYFLTILDDHTRFVWMILLKNKSEVSQHVQNFITMVIIQFHTTQDCKGKQWSLILARTIICIKGHYSSKSCVETPQQNSRVENKQQNHVLNIGKALLYQSKPPKSHLSYALKFSIFIINRVHTSILKYKSPSGHVWKNTRHYILQSLWIFMLYIYLTCS